MKAVIYHADAPVGAKWPAGTYERLIADLRRNVGDFGMPLVHLTARGHAEWGDENHQFDVDPVDVVWNREVCWIEFLRLHAEPGEVYWMAEPDLRVREAFPPLDGDLALLRRKDGVAISPSWRLARKSSLPFFEAVLGMYDASRKDWHGDSVGWVRMFEKLGKPGIGRVDAFGLDIELRDYDKYALHGSRYSAHFKAANKLTLL